jgi:hypothetical protein
VRVGEKLILILFTCYFLSSGDYSLCVRCYSPDVDPFRFCSALNPDSSIRMNCRYSPWLFAILRLRFAEYTVFYHKHFITDLVIVIDASFVFTLGTTICQ